MHGFLGLGGVRGRRLLGVFASAAVLAKKSSDSVSKNLSASQMELAPFERRGPVKDLVAPIRFLYLELAPFETVLTANPQVATQRHG